MKTTNKTSVLNTKVPLIQVIIFTTALSVLIYFIAKNTANGNEPSATLISKDKNESQVIECNPRLNVIRNHDFNLTRPFILADLPVESPTLKPVGIKIDELIKTKIEAGKLLSASVYLRTFNDGQWLNVNPNETFMPGSMIKVAIMITYLKMAEKYPDILNKSLKFEGRQNGVPNQTYEPSALVNGKSYTVKELLYYAIVESDNDATALLNKQVDVSAFVKLFTDIGLIAPNVTDRKFQMKASEYARFFRILYNSTYLKPEYSEFALQLLTESTFNKGIVKDLPTDLKIAHKFGEGSFPDLKQLHETAIIYLDNMPYLVCIMTKGLDDKLLPETISDISSLVYNELSKKAPL
jgi:beta-lactamase class A